MNDTVIDIQRKQNLEDRVDKMLRRRILSQGERKLLEILVYYINHATFGGWLLDDLETKLNEYEELGR